MTEPRREAIPALADYPFRQSDNVRFADLDPNQHVNNAVYASYLESGRVLLVRDRANGLMPDGFSYVLVRLDIHFRAELHWPGTIELGLGVAGFGRTSVTFAQAVFSGERCIASARSTTVMVDQTSRKPTPLPDSIRDAFRRWALRGAEI